jgi:hypothetical protein
MSALILYCGTGDDIRMQAVHARTCLVLLSACGVLRENMPREMNITDLERARRLAEQARDIALPANLRALVENMAATIDTMAAEIEDLRAALQATREPQP